MESLDFRKVSMAALFVATLHCNAVNAMLHDGYGANFSDTGYVVTV